MGKNNIYTIYFGKHCGKWVSFFFLIKYVAV